MFGISVQKIVFSLQRIIADPLGFTGLIETLLAVAQRFPGYFAQKSATLGTDIVYLELIGQCL